MIEKIETSKFVTLNSAKICYVLQATKILTVIDRNFHFSNSKANIVKIQALYIISFIYNHIQKCLHLESKCMFQLFYDYAMVSSVVLFLPFFLISAALKAVAGLPAAVSIYVDTFLGENIVKKRKNMA